HALSRATVQRLHARGTRLIVCVDCAITAVDEVAAARAAGLGVVVCDHHGARADGALPDCPIVHPALCDYPCPDLCGAGVAHKLAQALGAPTADEDLELVALPTAADPPRPGRRALMAVARVARGWLDTGALGSRPAPRITAAGRLRRADVALE